MSNKNKRLDTVFYEIVPAYQEQPSLIDIEIGGEASKQAALKALKYLAIGLLALGLQVIIVYFLVERLADVLL